MRFVYEEEGQKHEFQLRQGEFRIGRDPSCDIVTTNRSVSRKHILVIVKGTTVMVRDENSGNGMFVNDVRMPEAVLRNGDVLRAGKFVLRFEGEEDDRTIVSSGGVDQDGTMIDGGAAAPPPKKAPSASQREAAGHKTTPLDDVRDELEKIAAAPPPPKKSKVVAPPVAEPAPPAKIKIVKGMAPLVRELKGKFTIGTLDNNSLVLTGEGVSRNHSEIVVKDGRWVLKDLSSRNGTWVNGKKIDEHVLADGDSIQIGSVGMTFACPTLSPAAAAVPAGAAGEAVPVPPPPKAPVDATALAKKKKMLLVIACAAVGLIAVVGLLASINPEQGGGNGGATNGGSTAAEQFEKDSAAAWDEVGSALIERQYEGAAMALDQVRAIYEQYGQDMAEVKAWKKIVDFYLRAGANFSNVNGEKWDELKSYFTAAAEMGGYMADFAADQAGWCERRKASWKEIANALEAASQRRWADAVAHYKLVPDNDSIYATTAKTEMKNAIQHWKNDYIDKLNQFDNARDYEQCVATYKDMLKNIPEARNDRKLYERHEKWNQNVDASKIKRSAEQLIKEGKYDEALRKLDAASANDDKLLADIERLRAEAQAGETMTEVTKLYKEGKADEALARLGDVADQPVLAQLKQKISRVLAAYKDAQAAEDRKDYATAKRWWTEIVSSEDDRENFYRLQAEQKAGFDPTAKAAELTQQADAKMSAGDPVAARELAEQALTYVPGYEAAQRIVSIIVKDAETRYRMLYAGWKNKPVDEALKEAYMIKAMLRASDGRSFKGVNDLIERIQKEGGK